MDLIHRDYSKQNIFFTGSKKEYSTTLRKLGGKWKNKSKKGPGWIVPKTKEKELETLVKFREIKNKSGSRTKQKKYRRKVSQSKGAPKDDESEDEDEVSVPKDDESEDDESEGKEKSEDEDSEIEGDDSSSDSESGDSKPLEDNSSLSESDDSSGDDSESDYYKSFSLPVNQEYATKEEYKDLREKMKRLAKALLKLEGKLKA